LKLGQVHGLFANFHFLVEPAFFGHITDAEDVILRAEFFAIENDLAFGLLGPNDCRQTTLLRMVTGIFYPDEGEIIFDGKKFRPQDDILRIGYMPERTRALQENENWRTGHVPGPAQRPQPANGIRQSKRMVYPAGNAKLVE